MNKKQIITALCALAIMIPLVITCTHGKRVKKDVMTSEELEYFITENYLYNATTISHEGHEYVIIWHEGEPDKFHAEHSPSCPCWEIKE